MCARAVTCKLLYLILFFCASLLSLRWWGSAIKCLHHLILLIFLFLLFLLPFASASASASAADFASASASASCV
jgi:hypothetical protein